ncbi:leucine-rich repeat domain-containing protein [Brachyspira sp.]|uniref:leucine-rich repeat domain-containing protein n=1 Tax=Brachyspira sp. TaxID=1977261 RepID=UPI003D7D132C
MKYILLFLCILSLSCKYNVANPVGTLRDYTEGSGVIYYVSSSSSEADIKLALMKNKHSLGKYLIKVSATNDTSNSATNILNEIKKALTNNSSFDNLEVDISKLEGITEIPASVFKDVKNLGSISLSDKVTKINKEAFSGCSSLNNVRFSNGLTDILDSAFSNCSALTLVMLSSEKLTNIGTNAFSGCSSLVSIILSASLKTICNDAFTNCTKLANVEYLGKTNSISTNCKPFSNGTNPSNLYLPNASSGFSGSFLGKSDWKTNYSKHIPN